MAPVSFDGSLPYERWVNSELILRTRRVSATSVARLSFQQVEWVYDRMVFKNAGFGSRLPDGPATISST